MAPFLQAQDLAKAFGAQQLFQGLRLSVEPGDRIGLIGPNGSGKSTLLKILCGLEQADAGSLTWQKNLRPGYLAQESAFDGKKSVYACLEETGQALALYGAGLHARVQTLLSRAGFTDSTQKVAELSGGWRKRLALCQALLPAPDFLLLDEPTNHLDISGILWLEKLLTTKWPDSPAAWILVSHDRRFLENTVTRIIDLARIYPQGSLQVKGAYAAFLEKRSEFLQASQQLEERLANAMRRESEWLRRGPKARATKARYRIDAAGRLQEALNETRARNRETGRAGLSFAGAERKTKKLLTATGLSKAFAAKALFSNLDLILTPGLRLGLVGNNGCGKSTLLRILAASAKEGPELVPDMGTIRLADGVQIISFDQHREQLDPAQTLRRALAPAGDCVLYQGRSVHVVTWAKRFLFRPDQLETPLACLSGGEQARIQLARLMLKPADILLLDEPTNDLDIATVNVLEESLSEFPGALVLVTHDRFLLDRLCTHILGFDNRGHTEYFAAYAQWLAWLEENAPLPEKAASPVSPPVQEKAARPRPGKLSYLEQREYDQMEERILAAERELEEAQRLMESPEIEADAARLHECWQQREELAKAVEKLYARWSELEEKKKGA